MLISVVSVEIITHRHIDVKETQRVCVRRTLPSFLCSRGSRTRVHMHEANRQGVCGKHAQSALALVYSAFVAIDS